MTQDIDTSREAVWPARKALLNYTLGDMEGIFVNTSRQAIHEVDAALDALLDRAEKAEAELAALKAERDALRGVVRAARNYHDHSKAQFSDGDFDRDGGLAESEAELCIALHAITAGEGGA